jgi:hypothetical protein
VTNPESIDIRSQEGISEVIPLEMCYLGWQECLAQLALLVEPEIPDESVLLST